MKNSTLLKPFLAGFVSLIILCAGTPALAQRGGHGGGGGGGGFHGGGSFGGGGFHGGGDHGGGYGYGGGRSGGDGRRLPSRAAMEADAALEEEEVGPRVEVLRHWSGWGGNRGNVSRIADGQWHSFGSLAAASRRRELAASVDRLTGAEAITAGAAVITAGGAGMVAGADVGAAAGDLALGLGGGRDGVLFGIGRRMGIARGGTTGIRLTFIPMRTRWG